MSENKMSNSNVGAAMVMTAILVTVAYSLDFPLWVAVPLALVFSVGVAWIIEGNDEP